MFCKFCSKEVSENEKFCSNCGKQLLKNNIVEEENIIKEDNAVCEKEPIIEKESTLEEENRIFGFRSQKTWKELIALFYYFLGVVLIIDILFIWEIELGLRDILINKISSLLFLLAYLSPFILLSDFSKKIRNKIPLLKGYKKEKTFLFFFIIIIIIMSIRGTIDSFHSEKFKENIRIEQEEKEKAKQEAEKEAQEEKTKQEAEKKVKEEKAKQEAKERAKQEAEKKAKEEAEKYIKIDKNTLDDDLENNAAVAKEKYYGKYLEITGKLGTIDADLSYISLVSSTDSWDFSGINCKIKSEEQRKVIKTLKKGDKIVVKGKVTVVGEVLGYSIDIDEIFKRK